MEIIWDGYCKSSSLTREAVTERNAIADAAKNYRWDELLSLLGREQRWINASRLDGKSLYAPLHQAAHGGAPIEVAVQLIELGAWRTLQNVRGERAIDIAVRENHQHLHEVLTPRYLHHVPSGILLKIQSHFHSVIRGRAEELVRDESLRLPELEPLLEMQDPKVWFPVPGMYGGFHYWLAEVAP